MFDEEDYLPLSGLQHFAFCRRQWALIHVEQAWAENLRTVEGALLHERVHDLAQSETRGEVRTVRGMAVSSRALGLSGQCDAVEFYRAQEGIPLRGREGRWQPYPVEYKRGKPKTGDCDALQLCAQAMCLEEMLACAVPEGALFYWEIRRRQSVVFDETLRQQVRETSREMHEAYRRRYTPKVKTGAFCKQCSLRELCLPKLCKSRPVAEYIARECEGSP
jgi:CRISPR-associated exonuclease Cas4